MGEDQHLDGPAIARLRAVLTRLYLALRRNSPSDELTAAHASAIVTISDHGPLRMGEFARRESIRMPSATTLVDALVRKKLVERAPDPLDGRAVVVDMTEHGRRTVDELRDRRDLVLAGAVEALSAEHRAALLAALPALAALQARLDDPAGTGHTEGEAPRD